MRFAVEKAWSGQPKAGVGLARSLAEALVAPHGPEAPSLLIVGRDSFNLSFDALDLLSLRALTMVVFALLVINKAGGLIYNRNFAPGLQQLSSNDYLILAGTFHGIHAISRSLSPVAPPPAPPGNRANQATGIQSLESSHFRLTCFQTPTGTKFLLFTSPEQPNTDHITRRCYDIYADYVMANPFYSLEMPIRVDKFDRALAAYLIRP